MSTSKLPNLFDFATSELSQDAVLAYLFSWADREWADHPQHKVVHELGERMLRRLVNLAADASGKDDPLKSRTTLEVRVKAQRMRIDVLVEIDDDLALLIEDKTMTGEHGKQLRRYVESLEEHYEKDNQPREVFAVYVKTGNEAHAYREKSIPCGICRRPDVLDILSEYPESGNTIVEDFRRHLQRLESDTLSYMVKEPAEWNWRAVEGYYLHLEDRLPKSNPKWGYVSNPSGGFIALWLHVLQVESMGCNLYLQIHQGVRLTVRASSRGNGKVSSKQQWRVYEACRATADQGRIPGLQVSKFGRYGGGRSAAIADVEFINKDASHIAMTPDGRKATGYIAMTPDGSPDLDSTVERVGQAVTFLEGAARTLEAESPPP